MQKNQFGAFADKSKLDSKVVKVNDHTRKDAFFRTVSLSKNKAKATTKSATAKSKSMENEWLCHFPRMQTV